MKSLPTGMKCTLLENEKWRLKVSEKDSNDNYAFKAVLNLELIEWALFQDQIIWYWM